MSIYAPTLLNTTRIMANTTWTCVTTDCTFDESLTYGLGKCLSTASGIIIGVEINKHFQKRNPYGAPVVCAVALLVSVPLLCIGLLLVGISTVASQILFFISGICLAVNKVLVNEIILMVVLPNRRGWSFTEKATLGWLGNVGGEYVLYWASKLLEIKFPHSELIQNHRMEFLLFIYPLVALIGAGYFLLTAKYLKKDAEKVTQFLNTPTIDEEQPEIP
ncbi:protein spinster homolog 1-like [Xenopus tropicalis]|nr:protein spinster homolog 1-like [Xenopus tropicalis]